MVKRYKYYNNDKVTLDAFKVNNPILHQNEVQIFKRITHPNIIKYLGSEEIHCNLFIYLEYLPRGNIKSLINNCPLVDEKIIKKYIKGIVNGIYYLHNKGIVHRDIKAENILLDDDGTVKLTDFGCSGQIVELDEVLLNESNLLSSLKGTLLWMAPEVINQEKYGRKADVWSLGCTLLEILTGRNPWNNLNIENYYQALFKIGRSNEVPEIPTMMNIPNDLRDFLNCCLRRNFNDRPSIEELQNHHYLKTNI